MLNNVVSTKAIRDFEPVPFTENDDDSKKNIRKETSQVCVTSGGIIAGSLFN
jgi:hypothetical protein